MQDQARSARPTQRTIAERAGMSIGTVSRALANDPRIAEKTREIVQQIARDIGYTPDRAALRLRTGRTNVIGLILPPHDEILGFGTTMIRGITNALGDTNYHLVVMPDFGLEESNAVICRIVRDSLADGVIFSRTQPADERIRFLLEADFPFVTHGRSEFATPHAFVDFDNFEFARLAAGRLVEQGAGNLSILLPPRRFTFANYLQHGFMTAVRESGVRHEFFEGITLDSHSDEIKRAIEARYRLPDPPDGLVLPGEVSGLAALAAIQDLGLVPGRDVHLVAKQASRVFEHIRPRVTALYEDLDEAGSLLARLLLRRIAGEPAAELQFLQPVVEAPHA